MQIKFPGEPTNPQSISSLLHTGCSRQRTKAAVANPCQWLIIDPLGEPHAILICRTSACVGTQLSWHGCSIATNEVPDTVSQSPYLPFLRATRKRMLSGGSMGNEHGRPMSRLPAPGLEAPQLIILPFFGVFLSEPRLISGH